MYIKNLFEYRTGLTNITQYRRLYHLTDNQGFSLSIENNAITALSQDYISTTYRRETNSILGRVHYHYKLILNGKKLATAFGVFPYDHQVTEIGLYDKKEVSANEAEMGIDTKSISPLNDFLVGVVIMSKPYSENQVLFLADINRTTRGNIEVSKIKNIHAIEALNRLTVPIYWQDGNDYILLTEKDHNYLRDIESFMLTVDRNKSRSFQHLDILEKLLDKYEIKTNHYLDQTIDKNIINRRRQIPKIISTLNSYFSKKHSSDIDPEYLKTMMISFLEMLGYKNSIDVFLKTAIDNNFFHPTVKAVSWTGFIDNLIHGNVDAALAEIREEKPSDFSMLQFNKSKYGFHHNGTGMNGDEL